MGVEPLTHRGIDDRFVWGLTAKRLRGIIGADLATRHGFTQVPNFILTNEHISVGAKLAYAMLLKYAWISPSSAMVARITRFM